MPLFDRVALALLFIFMLTEILGGPIRYYAGQIGLPWVVYLPHLFLALILVPMFFAYLASEGISSTYLAILVLFSAGATFGVFNLGGANQVEFGLWIFVAFLFAIVALPSIVRGWDKLVPYGVVLWAVATSGVLINFFHHWPWVGLQYQVGATEIEASQRWATMGLERLPGFSRASFEASVQILILALFLRETLSKKLWIPVWILSGVAIALTTSKAPIAIFILFSLLWAFSRGSVRPSWRLIPVIAVSFDILLPFSMLFIRIDWLDSIRSDLWTALIASFADRLQVGWPEWLRMILTHGNPLLGRGLGGIGTAQRYFEPALASPADNIAVYLYGTFGVLGLILLCVYAWKARRMRVDGCIARFFFFCACFVLLEGVTVNVLEGSFMAMAFGASFRYLQEDPVVSRSRLAARAGRLHSSGAPSPRRAVGNVA